MRQFRIQNSTGRLFSPSPHFLSVSSQRVCLQAMWKWTKVLIGGHSFCNFESAWIQSEPIANLPIFYYWSYFRVGNYILTALAIWESDSWNALALCNFRSPRKMSPLPKRISAVTFKSYFSASGNHRCLTCHFILNFLVLVHFQDSFLGLQTNFYCFIFVLNVISTLYFPELQ